MTFERETIAVIINGQPVVIPLADAVAEYLRLVTLAQGRTLKIDEYQVRAALDIAIGSLNTGDEAQRLYEALKS